jgi:hypothetical protein
VRRFNFIRPLWIIAIAYLANTLVTNVSLLLGSSKDAATNLGTLAMIIAAIITFIQLNKRRENNK